MKIRKIRRRHLISVIIFLLFFLLGYLGLSSYDFYEKVVFDYKAEALGIMSQRMGQLFLEINDFLFIKFDNKKSL